MAHKDHLEFYLKYLVSESKAKRTIETYKENLMKYFNSYSDLTRDNILAFKQQISYLSPATVNQALSALKSFNVYLLENNLIDKEVILKADYKKRQAKGNPTNVTSQQINKFLNKVLTKKCMYQSRNIALIFLMAHTGIRREETCDLELKNLDLDEKELTIIGGKGDKMRTVLLTDIAVEYIRLYLVDRTNHKNATSSYLFVSERGDKLNKETINDIFNFYSTPKNHINPHAMRHSYASSVIEQDVLSISELQNQLGHSSINTTQVYVHPRKDSIKKKINKLQIG